MEDEFCTSTPADMDIFVRNLAIGRCERQMELCLLRESCARGISEMTDTNQRIRTPHPEYDLSSCTVPPVNASRYLGTHCDG